MYVTITFHFGSKAQGAKAKPVYVRAHWCCVPVRLYGASAPEAIRKGGFFISADSRSATGSAANECVPPSASLEGGARRIQVIA